jgi:hypothetical protein
MSLARTLVPTDKNWANDIFVHDRITGRTSIVSVDSAGHQGPTGLNSWSPSISGDGRYIAFASDAMLAFDDHSLGSDVFLHDRAAATTMLITRHSPVYLYPGWSDETALSIDGRYVAFRSGAIGLGVDDHNQLPDIFTHGPAFTLDATPTIVSSGKLLSLTVYTGPPGNTASLWVVTFDDSSVSLLLAAGEFNAASVFDFSTVVPPGLSGSRVGFRGYSIDHETNLLPTNTVTVLFQ